MSDPGALDRTGLRRRLAALAPDTFPAPGSLGQTILFALGVSGQQGKDSNRVVVSVGAQSEDRNDTIILIFEFFLIIIFLYGNTDLSFCYKFQYFL